MFILGVVVIKETADSNGNNRHNQDIQEHTDGIDFDDLASRQFHQQRRHHWGKKG